MITERRVGNGSHFGQIEIFVGAAHVSCSLFPGAVHGHSCHDLALLRGLVGKAAL